MKYLRIELYKMKHKGIFQTLFLILGVELLFIFSLFEVNDIFLAMQSNPTAPAWEYLITGPAALNGLFFSMLIAVLASRICDMEHTGNTLKLLESNNQTRGSIWMYKFIVISGLILIAIIIQILTIIIYGKAVNVIAPIPIKTLIGFAIGTAMISFVIITIQIFISLMISNQLISMAIGMIGALIGFISSLLPPVVRNLLIWGNFSELIIMDQNTSTELTVQSINFVPITTLFIFGMIAFYLFFYIFKQKEY